MDRPEEALAPAADSAAGRGAVLAWLDQPPPRATVRVRVIGLVDQIEAAGHGLVGDPASQAAIGRIAVDACPAVAVGDR